MKKFLCVIVFVLCVAEVSSAAPAYGTRMPKQGKIFVGLQNHTVLTQELEGDNGKMKSLQNFFLISFGVMDWLSIDLKGGAGNITQSVPSSEDIEWPTFVGGGYGFRVKFFDTQKTDAVFGFQHISIHPHAIDLDRVKKRAILDDWQLSLLASHDLKWATPYAGIKWSRMDYIRWDNDLRNRAKGENSPFLGPVAGLDIPMGEKWWLNFEANFADTEAVSGSINFAF